MAIIAMQECSDGNSEVGDMWIQTMVFNTSEPIINVLKWAKELRCHGGRLMICEPDNAKQINIEPETHLTTNKAQNR